MITATQYTRTYEKHQEYLQSEAKRIANSTEARVWLNKNAAVDRQTVEMALQCIGDLTGDYTASKNFKAQDVPRMVQSSYSLRKPVPNKYIEAIDNGTRMLECPKCKGRIQFNPFTYAVGNLGFQFCPYCGENVREVSDGNT